MDAQTLFKVLSDRIFNLEERNSKMKKKEAVSFEYSLTIKYLFFSK